MPDSAFTSSAGGSSGASSAFTSGIGGSDPYAAGSAGAGSAPAHHWYDPLTQFGHNAWKGVEGLAQIPVALYEGVQHPVRFAENLAKSEWQMWSPLVHLQIGKLLHQMYDNPVGYAMDLWGGGHLMAGALGKTLAHAGVDASTSGLGRLAAGKLPLETPSFAKTAGVEGAGDNLVKMSVANPLGRMRQQMVNGWFNHLPPTFKYVGSIARNERLLTRAARQNPDKLMPILNDYQNAVSKLNPKETVALHLLAQGLHPAEYTKYLTDLKAAGHPVEEASVNLVNDPGVLKAFESFSSNKNLQTAYTAGHALASAMTEEKIGRGILSPQAAAEAPYLGLRLTNGAKVISKDMSADQLDAIESRFTRAHDALTKEQAQATSKFVRGLRGYASLAKRTEWGMMPGEHAAQRLGARAADTHFATADRADPHSLRQALESASDDLARMHAEKFSSKDDLKILGMQQDKVASLQRQYDRAMQAQAQHAGAVESGTEGAAYQGSSLKKRRATRRTVPMVASLMAVGAHGLAKQQFEGRFHDLTDAYHEARNDATMGVHDMPGRELHVLREELKAKGMPEPFYLPHRPLANKRSVGMFAAPSLGHPASIVRHRQGIAFSQGRIMLNHDVLGPEMERTVRYAYRDDLHNAVMEHAIHWPKDEPVPTGWAVVKKKIGEKVPYLNSIAGDFAHELDSEISLEAKTAEEAATDPQGNFLIVPKQLVEHVQKESRAAGGFMSAKVVKQVSRWWKHAIIGLRPASFMNNTVGNAVLAAYQMAPGFHGIAGILRHVKGNTANAITGETMRKVFPEQVHGTFAEQHGYTAVKKLMKVNAMTPTVKVEQWMRRAMIEGWARELPEMKQLLRQHRDINVALRHAPQSVLHEISQRVDDALGDYRHFSKTEERLREVFPFYAWNRHAFKSAKRIANERPGRAMATQWTGQEGSREQEKEFPNGVPSFMHGAIKLPGLPLIGQEGRTPILNTKGLNPFTTMEEMIGLPGALGMGGPGGKSAEVLSSSLNPILKGAIEYMTGRDLSTGRDISKGHYGAAGQMFRALVGNLPQAKLAQAAYDRVFGQAPHPASTPLYSKDAATMLADFILGLQIKQANEAVAAQQKGR